MKKVVIIGGMAAGCKAASRLKRLEPGFHVTIVEQKSFVSYGACGMPLYASGDVDDFFELAMTGWGVVRTPEFFRSVKDVEVLVNTRAEKIDTAGKIVHCTNLENGDSISLPYNYLIISTGAEPSMPKGLTIPQSDRISTFHNPLDAKRFREHAQKGQIGSCAIIGGGFIGCELAEAMVSLWGIETTIIEKEDCLLSICLDKEMSAFLEKKLIENDIKLELNTQAEGIGLTGDGNPVILLSGSRELEADYMFLCPGVRPSVKLAAEAGILIGKNGGILTDKNLMTNIPDIYAGGDCIETENIITGYRSVLPLGSLANRHGRIIADNIAGKESVFEGAAGTFSMAVFNTITANTGITERAAAAAGIDYSCVWGAWSDRPDYHPGHKNIFAKMIYERQSGRLLGLQLSGAGEVTRNIDVFSFMLMKQCTVDDLLNFEHAYNPPHSGPLNPLYYLGSMALAEMRRGIECLNPLYTIKENEILIDVREDYESDSLPLREKHIRLPLSIFRNEIENLDKEKEYVVICQKGARSYEAAVIMKNAGFACVKYIGGGFSLKFALIDDNE